MPIKKLFSVAEAVALLEEYSISEADLVVLPPAHVDNQSDCERCDEDDTAATEILPIDIAGEIEVHYEGDRRNNRSVPDDDNQEDNKPPAKKKKIVSKRVKRVIDATLTSSTRGCCSNKVSQITAVSEVCEICGKSKDSQKKKSQKSKSLDTKWCKQPPKFNLHPINAEKVRVSALTALLIQKSEVELLEEFRDEDMFDLIMTQTNLYANRHEFQVKKYQLKRFIGFLIFSGYHHLPRERMYWENADDCKTDIVTESLSRQEYMDIKRNIHLADNTTVHTCDKYYKIRPYVDLLNDRFAKFGVFNHNLSVDEQMIPYFGRHSCKMYMKGKPVRFGFKVLCFFKASLFVRWVLVQIHTICRTRRL